MICLTVLGVVLIRRKRGATKQPMQPPGYTYNDRNDFPNTAELGSHHSTYVQKGYQWDSSHGPVEMNGSHHVKEEIVELPGQET
jgi:hypothetical protein